MVCSSFSSTSMGPSGELQSFKNRLLQHGSPTNPSSKNCSSLGFSPQTTACARILFLHGLSMGCRSYLLHHGPLMGSREIHALCLEHLLPSFCTNLGGYRVVSPPFSLSLTAELFFLNYVITEMPPGLLMGSILANRGSILELTTASWKLGQLLVSSHNGHPWYVPHDIILPQKPNTLSQLQKKFI